MEWNVNIVSIMNTFTRISNYEELNIIGTGMYTLFYKVLKLASIADQTVIKENLQKKKMKRRRT